MLNLCVRYTVGGGKISIWSGGSILNRHPCGSQGDAGTTSSQRWFHVSWLQGCCPAACMYSSPSGWIRFQPQIDRLQNRGTFLCHIGKYRGIIRSKIVFFRISNISVPCPHAQLRGRTVIKKLWTFFGPWGRDRSQSPPCWIFRVKQIHQSTASERTTRHACIASAYFAYERLLAPSWWYLTCYIWDYPCPSPCAWSVFVCAK